MLHVVMYTSLKDPSACEQPQSCQLSRILRETYSFKTQCHSHMHYNPNLMRQACSTYVTHIHARNLHEPWWGMESGPRLQDNSVEGPSTSLVPRLPRSGTRTLKLCRGGEPGIFFSREKR